MTKEQQTTLRLVMPQWQGSGANSIHPLGASLLAWLAPDSDDPLIEVSSRDMKVISKANEQALLAALSEAGYPAEQPAAA